MYLEGKAVKFMYDYKDYNLEYQRNHKKIPKPFTSSKVKVL